MKLPTQSFSWRLQDHMVQDAVDGIMPVAVVMGISLGPRGTCIKAIGKGERAEV